MCIILPDQKHPPCSKGQQRGSVRRPGVDGTSVTDAALLIYDNHPKRCWCRNPRGINNDGAGFSVRPTDNTSQQAAARKPISLKCRVNGIKITRTPARAVKRDYRRPQRHGKNTQVPYAAGNHTVIEHLNPLSGTQPRHKHLAFKRSAVLKRNVNRKRSAFCYGQNVGCGGRCLRNNRAENTATFPCEAGRFNAQHNRIPPRNHHPNRSGFIRFQTGRRGHGQIRRGPTMGFTGMQQGSVHNAGLQVQSPARNPVLAQHNVNCRVRNLSFRIARVGQRPGCRQRGGGLSGIRCNSKPGIIQYAVFACGAGDRPPPFAVIRHKQEHANAA